MLTSLFTSKDINALRAELQQQPGLANKSITYLDRGHGALVHPLHRLCDAVFANLLSDEQAVEMAKVLIEFGANVNGNYAREGSTPLIAAASLHCQQLGIYYIEQGADVSLTELNGKATALHWACYCGLDQLSEKLVAAGASLNKRDEKFNCTPTEWALHALMTQPRHVKNRHIACIKAMLRAGANQNLFAERFKTFLQKLAEYDTQLRQLLSK